MTIGEALKKERKDLGLIQAEMAAGVITTAHYSKIERDKHDISAYDLFEILTKNNINLVDFIKEIEDTYQSTPENQINLNLRLIHAFYQSDQKSVRILNKEIQESAATKEEKMRAILIEANVTHTIDQIPGKVRKEIKRILFENDDWVDDKLTLRLFCNSMLIFSHNELNFYINEIIDKYSAHFDQEDFHHQKLIASICVNFLYVNCINNNLDFDLAYGKKVLLQGPSGSGKSTLLNMVSGLLKPSHGTIKIGGEDPSPAQSVYIAQTPWLFQGTIKDNLCLGESFTDQQLLKVLSEVGLADELGKDPLNRVIHPEQEDLSGGQRQRLVIARALLRDRPIILLDEITAALDEKNSDDIREILYNTPKTIIESAHHINFDLTKKYGFESWMIEDHHLVNNK